jgi:hypothetical protein
MFQVMHDNYQQLPDGLVGEVTGGESNEEIIWQRDPSELNTSNYSNLR